MLGIAKLAFVFLFVPFLAIGQVAPVADPGALLQQAKALLAPGRDASDQVILLLREANAIWEQSAANGPQYAESLDLLAIMLRHERKDFKAWQTEAAPLVSRAREILDARTDYQSSEDLALALELQADVLGRENPGASAGAPFWNRAAGIRGQLVTGVAQRLRFASNLPPANPVYRVGGGVSQPSVITKVDPQYPEIARLVRQTGTVLLAVVVNAQGSAEAFRLLRGCGYGLDEKAAEAVLQWRFQPGMKNGQPVNVRATIEVNFRLL